MESVLQGWNNCSFRKFNLSPETQNAESEIQIIHIDAVGFITDEDLTGEALINSYQERMQELRDIYHSIRADQARLDRRWRKTLEKRSNALVFCFIIVLRIAEGTATFRSILQIMRLFQFLFMPVPNPKNGFSKSKLSSIQRLL